MEHMRMKCMKKAFSPLIIGCLACAIVVAPETAFDAGLASMVGGVLRVEAAPAPVAPLALVSGSVRDDAGRPLIGAVVALLEPQSRGRELQSVRTDLQGKFSATVAPGAYRLRATAEGFSSMLTRINLDRSGRVIYDFSLKRTDTLVQKRGDSDDYRWIARSVPRHVLNLRQSVPTSPVANQAGDPLTDEVRSDSFTRLRPTFHGLAQFLASQSSLPQAGSNFFGFNFAFAGSLDGNVEMALIGQRGIGRMAPQRLTAITSMRTSDGHKITASLSHGQMTTGTMPVATNSPSNYPGSGLGPGRTSGLGLAKSAVPSTFDQISVATLGEWQIAQPLLVIYGFDYSSFIGSAARQQDSFLPRFAIQYAPTANWKLNAAVTPGRIRAHQAIEEFKTENIQTRLELASPEVAFNGTPQLDRSQRYETGIVRTFRDGRSAIEGSAFYDLISGHGVGVMALPLEASPEIEAAFQRIANQVTSMNGAARGTRLMYRQHIGSRLTASLGYSAGSGSRFQHQLGKNLKPAQLFRDGFFQVATAKLDLDLSDQSGTRVSTVIRLSPTAVIFAIDPFAGRMSVYDPNINIYVTQELPSFGLPIQWQAIVDLRNLLNQTTSVEDGAVQLLATRNSRTIRGGLAFRW